MTYFLWILAITVGFMIGRYTVPKERAKLDEHLESQNRALKEDVAYYKKLTRNLVEENKELRKNV